MYSASSLLQLVCASRQQVQVELLEREEVVRELGLLKGWIQDTQGLLLSPTADLDTLFTDLEVLHSSSQRSYALDVIRYSTDMYDVLFSCLMYSRSLSCFEILLIKICA